MSVSHCLPEAIKAFGNLHSKYENSLSADAERKFNLSGAKQVLGKAYVTLAEGKLMEELSLQKGPETSATATRKAVEKELTRIAQFSKEFSVKIKASMHQAIVKEAESVLLLS